MQYILNTFYVICLLQFVVGLKYNKGCISESQLDLDDDNYDVFGWPWSEVHIGAWVPKEFNAKVLDISIEYKDHLHENANEYIMIYRNETEVTTRSQNKNDSNQWFNHTSMHHGWAGFIFRIDSQVMGIYKSDDHQKLFKLELQGDIENIVIKGSNLTINCQQGFPIWWVLNSDIVIPLDSTSYSYNFTLYSTRPFSPSFKFNKEDSKISFAMSNSTNEISTAHADNNLTAHTYHNIYIICENNIICHCLRCEILNTNSNSIDSFTLPTNPDYITVFKEDPKEEDFFVTLYKRKKIENEACHNLNGSCGPMKMGACQESCLTTDDIVDSCDGQNCLCCLEKACHSLCITCGPQGMGECREICRENEEPQGLGFGRNCTCCSEKGILADTKNVKVIISILAVVACIGAVAIVILIILILKYFFKSKSGQGVTDIHQMNHIHNEAKDKRNNGRKRDKNKIEDKPKKRDSSYSNDSYTGSHKEDESNSGLLESQAEDTNLKTEQEEDDINAIKIDEKTVSWD